MKSLLELRKEAQTLGIENYAKYTKDELAEIIEAKKAGVTVTQEPETIMTAQDEVELTDKVEADGVEEITASEAEELTPEGKKKLKPEEKLAARKAKEAEKKAAKEAEKAAKKQAKEDAKAARKAEKAAARVAKKPLKATVKINFTPKQAEKPVFKAATSSAIYDELLKNDGRSYGAIAREIGSHYNMVRRIAEIYFDIAEEKLSEGEIPTTAEQVTEATASVTETAE